MSLSHDLRRECSQGLFQGSFNSPGMKAALQDHRAGRAWENLKDTGGGVASVPTYLFLIGNKNN